LVVYDFHNEAATEMCGVFCTAKECRAECRTNSIFNVNQPTFYNE